MVKIGVNKSYFIRRVLPKCFLSFFLPEDVDISVWIFLDSSWFFIFKLFFEVMDMFINVFRVFF
jgi:hypothetical protein